MKAITIHVSEETYRVFQESAARSRRSASDLIREAMQEYSNTHLTARGSIFDHEGADVGRVLQEPSPEDDLLDEMLS